MAEQFKALADPQRLRVVALCRAGELSVSELTEVLGQSQPRVSQHLKILVAAGLLDRFRDGKRVFYRLANTPTALQRGLVRLIAGDEAAFEADLDRLRRLRGSEADPEARGSEDDKAIARALIELTLAHPVGDLLDIGCGRGRVLKLLASRANRAVGIDIDSRSRDFARIDLFLAGANNCSLRKGDMHALDFDAESFDTVVLDDVLANADDPGQVLEEARRVLRPHGRVLILQSLEEIDPRSAASSLASLSAERGLRFAPPRAFPAAEPAWLLSTLTKAESGLPSSPPPRNGKAAGPFAAQR